jgi:hypothetical protein
MRARRHLRPIGDEFQGAELGDHRRSERLLKIAEALEKSPAVGFPRAMRSDAELEALYRFVNNGAFSARDILAPHFLATRQRAMTAGEVLVIHDSTYFQPAKEAARTEVGIDGGGRRFGFGAHVALLTDLDGTPLGLADLETFVRAGKSTRKSATADEGKTMQRWVRAVENAEILRAGDFSAIHIADAEGDFFEFLATMERTGARYVVRAGRQVRQVDGDDGRESLRAVVDRLKPQTWRTIELSERRYVERLRGPHSRSRHPQRAARPAKVAMAQTRISLPKPSSFPTKSSAISVNVVRIWEPKPPRGQPAIEWILLTNDDVGTTEALARTVDLYRRRWLVEEYFKALKTGCSLEKRQVGSYSALKKVLALLAPIAYRLLLLRAIHRRSSTSPAGGVFDATDLTLIARAQRTPAPIPKTIDEALMLLARLGGHVRNNGDPGWMTLGAGYETLLILRLGWHLGREST